MRTLSVSGKGKTIGRASGNDLVLSDPTVSRLHAFMCLEANGILVVDRDSTNGTIVHRGGSTRVVKGCTAIVPDGTVIEIGQSMFRLEADEG